MSFFLIYLGYFALALPPVADALSIGSGGLAAIRYVGMLFPHTCFAFALRAVILSNEYGYNVLMPSPGNVKTIEYFDLPVETAFGPIIFLFVDIIMFTAILIYLESNRGTTGPLTDLGNFFSQTFRCACCSCCYSTQSVDIEEEEQISEELEDNDVRRERISCSLQYGDENAVELSSVVPYPKVYAGEEKEEEKEDENFKTESIGEKKEKHAVVFQNVRKQYPPNGKQRYISDGTVAVRDVSLRIREGEIFGLLGSNGAGKSTLLNVLMRQLSPTRGNVFVWVVLSFSLYLLLVNQTQLHTHTQHTHR